jgi:1-phosphatidylinositol-4-phosphate 5-kinase
MASSRRSREWRHRKATRRDKFSWPSGATYEGEFKDGASTCTGATGDMYKASWSMNLKHGDGRKSYVNGDHYDGEWSSGCRTARAATSGAMGPSTRGWRTGLIHGRGALAWPNGNRYDGGWEDGCPSSQGTFRWADDSVYVGFWTRDSPTGIVQQKGIYCPSAAAASRAHDPRDVFAKELPGFMGGGARVGSCRRHWLLTSRRRSEV